MSTRSEGVGDPPPLIEPFTVESLKALLERHRVIRSGKPPNAAGFQGLARTLNFYHTLVREYAGPLHEARERKVRIADAVRVLAKDLPAECANALAGVDPLDDSPNYWRRECEALAALLAAVEKMRDPHFYSYLDYPPGPKIRPLGECWHDLAPSLAEAFTEAMRTTHPSWKFVFRSRGAGPRFLSAVAPLITGDTPSEDAIVQFFKRLHRAHGDMDECSCP